MTDPAPSWLRRYVPEHYYRDFNVVSLRGPQVDDATLGPIEGLEQVEELYLDNSGITDAGLARLRGSKAPEIPGSLRDAESRMPAWPIWRACGN